MLKTEISILEALLLPGVFQDVFQDSGLYLDPKELAMEKKRLLFYNGSFKEQVE